MVSGGEKLQWSRRNFTLNNKTLQRRSADAAA